MALQVGRIVVLDPASRRIVILGSPGSGKTTFARQLAAALDLPHINLDDLYWQPGWHRPDEADFVKGLKMTVNESAWIIDGNYHRYLAYRLSRADTVVLLDIAPWLCAIRVLVRACRRKSGERSSLPRAVAAQADYRHTLKPDMRFWRLIASFRRSILPGVQSEIAAMQHVRLVTLRGTSEIGAFLAAAELSR